MDRPRFDGLPNMSITATPSPENTAPIRLTAFSHGGATESTWLSTFDPRTAAAR